MAARPRSSPMTSRGTTGGLEYLLGAYDSNERRCTHVCKPLLEDLSPPGRSSSHSGTRQPLLRSSRCAEGTLSTWCSRHRPCRSPGGMLGGRKDGNMTQIWRIKVRGCYGHRGLDENRTSCQCFPINEDPGGHISVADNKTSSDMFLNYYFYCFKVAISNNADQEALALCPRVRRYQYEKPSGFYL